MPKVTFSEENIQKNDYDYPKFKLGTKGEVARIAIIEDPVAEFVHNIRKPKLVGGVPEKVIKQGKKGEYEDYVYEFVARPICLGDYSTLQQDGSDPDRCPICAEAKRSDRFSAPQRRFALHVLRYETKPNSTEVKEPFSARTEVYSFTDKVFNKFYSFKQEGFDLKTHDLVVKCENPDFAGYDFSVSMKGEWTESDSRKDYVRQLFQAENLAPDLAIFCGNKKTEKGIEYDIRAVNEAWDQALGINTQSATDSAISSVGTSLVGGDISSILDTPSATTTADAWATPDAEPAASFEDLVPSEKPAPTGNSKIDDILAGL